MLLILFSRLSKQKGTITSICRKKYFLNEIQLCRRSNETEIKLVYRDLQQLTDRKQNNAIVFSILRESFALVENKSSIHLRQMISDNLRLVFYIHFSIGIGNRFNTISNSVCDQFFQRVKTNLIKLASGFLRKNRK